jgi:PTS system galactitol-specific IIA component
MAISNLLNPQAIFIQLEARNSEEVIRTLGGKLYELGLVKDNFIEATLAREANMPTGLPLGGDINAALPHVDIEYVNKPALALATLKQPVVFHNMVEKEEEVPVRLVIMLALDKPKSQVETLQQIAGVLQRPDIVAQLMNATTPADILALLASVESK